MELIGWIIRVSTRLNRFSFFLCWIWRTTKDFSAFTLNPKQQKITFVNVVLNILLILTYCLLVVFAPCFIYSLKFVISHVCQTVKVTELTTVPFGKTNHTCCATYFFCSTSWKKIYFTDFFIRRCLSGNCRSMWRADSLSLSFFFWLQNIIMYTALPWFSFSLFYILLFSVHIINVNAAKSGTVSWHVLIGFLSQAVGLFTINECE